MNEVEATFLIADLSGYTALTEAHGDSHAAGVLARYAEIAEGALEPEARLVERVGDELLIVAGDVSSAVRTAVKLRDAVEREPLFPTVRAGMHAGRVLEQNGRYFGAALNLTARVAAYARGGQILCTDQVAASVEALRDVECRAVGRVSFKHIVDPVSIFEIVPGSESGLGAVLDPVCRMQVRPDTAPARLPFESRTYYFCSFECARVFAERPDRYSTS